MPSIKTLIPDIQRRLISAQPFNKTDVEAFGQNLATKLANRLSEEKGKPSLRISNLGTPCDRKLWYSIKHPELAEPLSPSARLKFLFGDIIEEVVLFLARAAGHEVTDEQKEIEIDGVRGHIDGRVDGVPVDVKSASSYSYRKFKDGTLADDDPFGYRVQLGSYVRALGSDSGAFIAVDKQLGHITLDEHKAESEEYYKSLVAKKRSVLASPEPPPRGYAAEREGASGNRKLGVTCSYCPFKQTCWPGLRVFKYSNKPVFLVSVVRVPNVPEISLKEVEQ